MKRMLSRIPLAAALCGMLLMAPVGVAAERQSDSQMQQAPVSRGYPMTIQLNTASVEQLQALRGIGITKAKAIVEYRQRYGDFQSVDELIKVKGIGPTIIKQNQGLLSL